MSPATLARMTNVGVIYIGDREAGKTHLAIELANPKSECVTVDNMDYQFLCSNRLRADGYAEPTNAAQSVYSEPIDVRVRLPAGGSQIRVDWLDTPGEVWRQSWQKEKPEEWKRFLDNVLTSEGILLVLPPYRDLIRPGAEIEKEQPESFPTQQQWCNRFNRWVDFFTYECPNVRHLLLCLNKADLFQGVDLTKEAKEVGYDPYGENKGWQERHMYIMRHYFHPVIPQIKQINTAISGLTVRCFITTIRNRQLLELPWIYLGMYLAE